MVRWFSRYGFGFISGFSFGATRAVRILTTLPSACIFLMRSTMCLTGSPMWSIPSHLSYLASVPSRSNPYQPLPVSPCVSFMSSFLS